LGISFIFKKNIISSDKLDKLDKLDNVNSQLIMNQFITSVNKKINEDKSEIENIEYAIPVVAPYSSIVKNKFHIKIIPGTQKIKKSLPEIISHLLKKANLIEKLAIKKISNDSIQKVLVSGVKFIY